MTSIGATVDWTALEREVRTGRTDAARAVLLCRAFHEAGHVIAALELGFPFLYVTLRPRDRDAAAAHVKRRATRRHFSDWDVVVLGLAGPIAETRHVLETECGCTPSESEVVTEAQDRLSYEGSESDRRPVEQWGGATDHLWEEAAALVFGHWDEVSAIARSLAEHKTLTERRARQTAEAARARDRCETGAP